MARYILPNPATHKRLNTRLDYNEDILYYGLNNMYPQEMEQLRLRSPLVKSSTEMLEDFINGSGWTENNEVILNDGGDSTKDVLNLIALDYAKYNGFALHINFNVLGDVTGISNIPFEYCRLGLPDALGKVRTIVVSNNWEKDPEGLPQRGNILTRRYPIFNPMAAGNELLFGDGRGQVLYFTGLEKWKYPLTTFDAIINTAEADELMQSYERNNIKLGFHGTTIFKYPGKFETKEEELEVKKLVASMNGESSPGVIVAQVDEDWSGELLETIPSGSDDALFSATLISVLDRVLQNFKMPPALLGVSPSGAVFSQAAYLESFTVFNVITRNRRDKVSRIMNTLSSLWVDGAFSLGPILENRFDIQGSTVQEVSDKITTTGATIEGAEVPKLKAV